MTEKKIKLPNSIELNVLDSDRNEPVILLLHFSVGSLQMWNGVIPFLKDKYRVIAPDLRGHGQSSKPSSGYHIDDLAEDIYYLLKELHIDQCHIVGSSLGAEVGLSFAAKYPKKVLSIVCEGALYNEYGEFGLFNGTNEEIKLEKEKRLTRLKERKPQLYPTKEEFMNELEQAFKEEGLWNIYFQQLIESIICQTEEGFYSYCLPTNASKEYAIYYWDFNLEEYYMKIKCPVLFLPSKEDWENEKIRGIVHQFAKMINDSQIYLIDEAKHAYVWMQFPEKASKVVIDFIAEAKKVL